MRRENGSCAFVGSTKVTSERDADIGIEAGAPHEDKVFAKFIYTKGLGVVWIALGNGMFSGLVKKELEGFTESLSGVEVL
jgi:hypothetical protein